MLDVIVGIKKDNKKKEKGDIIIWGARLTLLSSTRREMIRLQLIEEVVEVRDALLQSLALTDTGDDRGALASGLERIARDGLPVIEHALREGLTLGLGTKIIIETE